MENIINIGLSKFWVENNEILYCKFNNKNASYRLDIAKVELYIEAIIKLCNGKPMPFIIDIRDSRGTFSTSAANLIAKAPSLVKLRVSEAYILNSIGIKLLIASYKRLYDPITPFSVFSNLESAKEYCITSINNFYGSN